MRLLIDGYNLLQASTLEGRGPKAGSLEAGRRALLDFLVRHLCDAELCQTTVVFDGQEAPPGLPSQYEYSGITVRFSRNPADADEVLETLIRAHTSPRQLTVVSSDHRVQRAARRRRAQAIDSERWLQVTAQQANATATDAKSDVKPTDASAAEVAEWLRVFHEPERPAKLRSTSRRTGMKR